MLDPFLHIRRFFSLGKVLYDQTQKVEEQTQCVAIPLQVVECALREVYPKCETRTLSVWRPVLSCGWRVDQRSCLASKKKHFSWRAGNSEKPNGCGVTNLEENNEGFDAHSLHYKSWGEWEAGTGLVTSFWKPNSHQLLLPACFSLSTSSHASLRRWPPLCGHVSKASQKTHKLLQQQLLNSGIGLDGDWPWI